MEKKLERIAAAMRTSDYDMNKTVGRLSVRFGSVPTVRFFREEPLTNLKSRFFRNNEPNQWFLSWLGSKLIGLSVFGLVFRFFLSPLHITTSNGLQR